jgi:hypothetical protein
MEGGLGFCTFGVCADGIKVFQKLFNTLQLLTFYLFLNYYLKMLTDTLLRIPYSVFYGADLIGCRDYSQELTCHRRLLVLFY